VIAVTVKVKQFQFLMNEQGEPAQRVSRTTICFAKSKSNTNSNSVIDIISIIVLESRARR